MTLSPHERGQHLSLPPHGAQHPVEGFKPHKAEMGPPLSDNVGSSPSCSFFQGGHASNGSRSVCPHQAGAAVPMDRGQVPNLEPAQPWVKAAQCMDEERTDRWTDTHLQHKRWEACPSANLLRAQPAHQLSVLQDRRTDSSSRGGSVHQAAQHSPALAPAAKATKSPSVPLHGRAATTRGFRQP